jgi:hypothetical protein
MGAESPVSPLRLGRDRREVAFMFVSSLRD